MVSSLLFCEFGIKSAKFILVLATVRDFQLIFEGVVMKKLFALCSMCVLGCGLMTSCFFVEEVEGDYCDPELYDEYCNGNAAVRCIHNTVTYSECGSMAYCDEHDVPFDINTRASCVSTVEKCDPYTFVEYCDGNTPVICLEGLVQYATTCYPGTTCVEFVNGRSACVMPELDEYGGDGCDILWDSNIDLYLCEDSYTYVYQCVSTRYQGDFWQVKDYIPCDYGCNSSGSYCY